MVRKVTQDHYGFIMNRILPNSPRRLGFRLTRITNGSKGRRNISNNSGLLRIREPEASEVSIFLYVTGFVHVCSRVLEFFTGCFWVSPYNLGRYHTSRTTWRLELRHKQLRHPGFLNNTGTERVNSINNTRVIKVNNLSNGGSLITRKNH